MAILQLGQREVQAQAILFDKDGTLIDFDIMWCNIIETRARLMVDMLNLDDAVKDEIIRAMGIDPETRKVHPRGPVAIAPRAEVLISAVTVLYLQGINWDEAKKVVEKAFEQTDQYLKLVDMIQPVPGMVECLERLKRAGVKVVIATTDNEEKARKNLPILGIEKLVDLVVGGNSVQKSKPDPEMVYLICQKLNLNPRDVVMVGDAVTDVMMGKNAGAIAAVGVLTGVTAKESLMEEADIVLDSVADIQVIEGQEEDVEDKKSISSLTIYSDGGSRGNPGEAGIGAVIYDEEGNVLQEISGYIGKRTNNEAEYMALITGLKNALSISKGTIKVFADSELMIKQIKGEYKVKNERLRPLYLRLMKFLHQFESYQVTHVLRAKNKEADRLANEGMDRKRHIINWEE